MKFALGTAQFGLDYGINNNTGRVASKKVETILSLAREYGMDTLDTAVAYGDSETVLGSVGVTNWKVVSKLPAVPNDCSDVRRWVNKQALSSLSRLGVTRLYGFLLHRPCQLLDKNGSSLHAALQSLKEQDLVSKIGVSVYSPAELDFLLDKYNFDMVQAPLNILDRRLVDSGWANQLKNAGIEIHTRSAFLQGLLLMSPSIRPKKFDCWSDTWIEWNRWLSATGLSPLQACLRYLNTTDSIDRVVVGIDTIGQLEEIIKAAEGKLTNLPDFKPMQDNRLINPASWNQL